MKNSSIKDRGSLSSYAKSQHKQIPGLSHPPSSARTTMRDNSNRVAYTSTQVRRGSKPKMSSEIDFESNPNPIIGNRPGTQGSIRSAIQAEGRRIGKKNSR